MFKIPKPEYTAEFKDLAVKRVKDGQGIGAMAKDPEQMDLSRVRAENARLRTENEI